MNTSVEYANEQATGADVIGWLTDGLKETARWRREKALQFPDDRRNFKAAEACERLSRLTALSDDAAARYIAAVEEVTERQSEVLRGIGFYSDYETLDDLLDAILPDAA